MGVARLGLSPAEVFIGWIGGGVATFAVVEGELQGDLDDPSSSGPKVVVIVSFEVLGVGPERFFFGKVGRAAVERI